MSLLTRSSNLHRRKLCPGSGRAEAGLPEEHSDDAAEGTLLHALMADSIADAPKLNAEQESVLESASETRMNAISKVASEIQSTAPTALKYELELVLHGGLEPILIGHTDLQAIFGTKAAYIQDTKFGRIPVEPADVNLQIASYAVMSWRDTGISDVFAAINQPRLRREQRLTMARYNEQQLRNAEQEIIGIIEAAEKPDATRIPGEAQCKYCLARHTCNERQEYFKQFSQMTIHASGQLVDNATLEALYDRCGLAKKLIGEIEAEMKRRLETDPDAFGGRIGLKHSQTSTITNMPSLFARLLESGARHDEIHEICPPPTKKDLEELLRKVTGKKGNALKDAMKQLLDDITVSKPKAPSLERRTA